MKSSVSVGVVSDLAFSIGVLPLGVTIFCFYCERKSKFRNTEEYVNYCCVNFSEKQIGKVAEEYNTIPFRLFSNLP